MNPLRHITRLILGTIVTIWLLAFIIPKIPQVQQWLGNEVSTALSQKLGTKVKIGEVDLRLPWRLVIDDVTLYDQQGKKMLQAGRIAAGIEFIPLIEGKIRISSAQLFATHIALYQKDARSPLNCQFVIDSLKSKDTTSHTPLDLAIASIVIRHSSLSYDRLDIPSSLNPMLGSAACQQQALSPLTSHLKITDLSSNIILNALTDDSLNVQLRHISLKEQSGLTITDVKGMISVAKGKARITGLSIALPHSKLNIDGHFAPLSKEGTGDVIIAGHLTPSDFTFLEPRLQSLNKTLSLRIMGNGGVKNLKAKIDIDAKDRSVRLHAACTAQNILDDVHGNILIADAHISQSVLSCISKFGVTIPKQVTNLGDITISGNALMTDKTSFSGNANITMSNSGKATIKATYHDKMLTAHLQTPGLALNKITGTSTLGNIICDLDMKTSDVSNLRKNTTAHGTISSLTCNNYTYRNISLDGSLIGNNIRGRLDISDPNITMHAEANADIATKHITFADIDLQNLVLKRLNITNAIGDTPLSAHLTIQPDDITLSSDILDVNMHGTIDLATLPYSLTNIISSQLPSLPGLPRSIKTNNDYDITTTVKDGTILEKILKTDFDVPQGITLNGFIHDSNRQADITLSVPEMTLSGNKIYNTSLHLFTPDESVKAFLSTSLTVNRKPVDITLECCGKDNILSTTLSWDNLRENVFKGQIFTSTEFGRTLSGKTSISAVIPFSSFQVGDSTWTIQAQRILYADDIVSIDNFHVGNSSQKVFLNGIMSPEVQDSLVADLQNVNIRYILDLVNFHSVDFDGKASGHLVAHSILGNIKADGFLDVAQFQFEKGNIGDMHLDAQYNNLSKRIDINALAIDTIADARTYIRGDVSPTSPGGLDLDIKADNTRLEFIQTFCESFMTNSRLNGQGRIRLFGTFDNLNLSGSLVAKGDFTLSTTNCRYTLPSDTVTFIPDDILFQDVPLIDKNGNKALLHGGVHHQHLTNMSYDLDATTTRFLAYDYPVLKGDDNFCGRAIINGDIGIHGKGNELIISADATPLKGSYFTYNASSPTSVGATDIITWHSTSQLSSLNPTPSSLNPQPSTLNPTPSQSDRTNIHMQLQIHATPQAKVNLLMDETTGDHIDIFGTGDLRLEYFNKGGLNIFGSYEVDHGTYKMTLQNIIRRDFSFRKGGMLTFGGDPYNAIIDMHAVYALNSVPLADLNIGQNFAANNVPVNCLMNITGTPGMPKIAFSVELPTMSTDARQMINAVINSEEEMNQQVLYLLAIGRFYAPSALSTASATTSTTNVSQSTLAVQSFLSGTLSQSFNNMMSSVMSRLMRSGNNFSFGANIAPGNEGFNNAEYEGLLSGNFFNNRLIFNGQFGYRDRVSTNTSSFIGDFSLQYLLTKNGAISLKVYNQTNDRYFTKNALNTQGIGVVFQKEWGK